MDYWDTSTVVKLYVREPDSEDFLQLLDAAPKPMYSSTITDIELLCTLYRKEKTRNIPVGSGGRSYEKFREDCAAGHIVRVPYGDEVVSLAEEVVRAAFKRSRPILIRSLDVIHIATALTIKAKRVVTTDSRLREVAALNALALLP
jgi:predicted nucleic acid-binding protein